MPPNAASLSSDAAPSSLRAVAFSALPPWGSPPWWGLSPKLSGTASIRVMPPPPLNMRQRPGGPQNQRGFSAKLAPKQKRVRRMPDPSSLCESLPRLSVPAPGCLFVARMLPLRPSVSKDVDGVCAAGASTAVRQLTAFCSCSQYLSAPSTAFRTPPRGSGVSPWCLGMTWMWTCGTVWPAASPSFTPTVKVSHR